MAQRTELRSALGRGVQAKMKVGPRDDAYEREADRVADDVVRRVASRGSSGAGEGEGEGESPRLRLLPSSAEQEEDAGAEAGAGAEGPQAKLSKAEDEEVSGGADGGPQTKASEGSEEDEDGPQRTATEGGEEEEGPQRKASEHARPSLGASLAARLAAPVGGAPVSAEVRGPVEARLGRDLSAVRVHDDAGAASDAASLKARAFTYRDHVYLGAGERATDLRLMAHELTHVVQQGASGARIQRSWNPFGALAQLAGDKAKAYVASKARKLRGYGLFAVLLGRDPITKRKVSRTPWTVLTEVARLLRRPKLMARLRKAGRALGKAWAWLRKRWRRVGLSWASVKRMFAQWWKSVKASPTRAYANFRRIFLPPIDRALRLVRDVGGRVVLWIFEGIMKIAGPYGRRVFKRVRAMGKGFFRIIKNPWPFAQNVFRAVSGGVGLFRKNIWKHLKKGMADWLLGTVGKAGIQVPAKLDTRGVVSLALQILGLTWDNLRVRLVRRVGERLVSTAEKGVSLVVKLHKEGPVAVWEQIAAKVGSIYETVIGGIRSWAITKIVTSAILKLISMLNPAGAAAQVVHAVYKVITFFVERYQQIKSLVNTVWSSLSAIAAGKTAKAAQWIEKSMARALPVMISFLARLLGLGGISERIKAVVGKLRKPFDRAMEKVAGWIAKRVRGLVKRGKAVAGKVGAWWRKKWGFKVGGESHEIYFAGGRSTGQVMVASMTPTETGGYIRGLWSSLSNSMKGNARKVYGRALVQLRDVYRIARGSKGRPADQKLKNAITELRARVQAFMSMAQNHGSPNNVIKYGSLAGPGFGTMALAFPLTSTESGSKTGTPKGPYARLKNRVYKSGRAYYRQGHLIHYGLGGPGKDPRNLAPITQSANSSHFHWIEKPVLKLVGKKSRIIRYRVAARYGQHERAENVLENAKNRTGISPRVRFRLMRTIMTEWRAPTGFSCSASYFEPPTKKNINIVQKFVGSTIYPGGKTAHYKIDGKDIDIPVTQQGS